MQLKNHFSSRHHNFEDQGYGIYIYHTWSVFTNNFYYHKLIRRCVQKYWKQWKIANMPLWHPSFLWYREKILQMKQLFQHKYVCQERDGVFCRSLLLAHWMLHEMRIDVIVNVSILMNKTEKKHLLLSTRTQMLVYVSITQHPVRIFDQSLILQYKLPHTLTILSSTTPIRGRTALSVG